jgi:hypothetical protein
MGAFDLRVILMGVFLVLSIVSGIIVSAAGRPLNIALSTLHKLIAIASVVCAVLFVASQGKNKDIGSVTIAFIVLTGVLLVSLFATGAVLSFDKPAPSVILLMHKAAPVLTVVSAAMMVYFQFRGTA